MGFRFGNKEKSQRISGGKIMLTLTFLIQFDSNYHVGAGYGKGFNVDSALLREADGKPVLRGSTLAGLLRDSAYRLLSLKPLSRHNPDEILGQLFGTPGQAKRWHVSSAQINCDCTEDSESIQRVRIDPRLRRAEEGKLFSQEEGFAGQRFFFSATCPCQNATALEIVLDEAALMVAAARNVRQLGRSRRRGLGECTIRLTAVATDVSESEAILDKKNRTSQDWLLERFDRAWMQGFLKNRDITEERIPSGIKTINTPVDLPIRLRIIVRLDEPLLIAQRSSAGNQYDTRSFIHGGIVMGAFAAMAAENCDLNNKMNYCDFIEIFLRMGIKFSMLYPGYYQSSSLYPSIPAPLGLVTCSVVPSQNARDGHGDYPARDLYDCPECANRMVPVEGFVILRRLLPNKLSTKRTSELHIRINEKSQRSAKGDLYGYSAMSSEQYFVGELTCSNEAIWKRLKEMTGIDEKVPLKCRLGKARSRGYGLVTVWLERCDEQPQTWIQIPLNQRVSDKSQIVSITLLTDTIIPNSYSQQAIGFESDWLESALGLGNVKIKDAYARTRVVDSFNSKLGLPRWRDAALVAGSTAWVHLIAPPDDWMEQMKKLELNGIGLRRNEGFGQIAFNHPVFDQRQKLTESAIMLKSEMRPSSSQSPDRFMEEWEDYLGRLLPQSQMSNAPFQALAQWLHTYSDKPIQELIDYFTQMKDPKKSTFGQPDKALIYAISETEYGKRDKKNPFIEKGKDDIEKIIKLLEYLKKEDSRYWRSGIERLAEWIALACRDERKGGIQ
jgi:CRISPR-associated protein Csx10